MDMKAFEYAIYTLIAPLKDDIFIYIQPAEGRPAPELCLVFFI